MASSCPCSNRGLLKYCIYFLLFFLSLGLFASGNGQAYIMPVEQLMGLMANNFSKNDTLIITKSTSLLNAEDGAEALVVEEKIWAKSPNLIRSSITGVPGLDDVSANGVKVHLPVIDTAFYRLLMANDRTDIMALLSEMGVNLEVVSFTRLGRIIAYRVGDRYVASPVLLVDKERFLPIFLKYRYWRDSQWKTMTVRFDDYQKREKRWFPGKINLFLGEEFDLNSFITGVQVNMPIENSIFEQGEKVGSDDDHQHEQGLSSDRPLKEMIKTLREKYGTH